MALHAFEHDIWIIMLKNAAVVDMDLGDQRFITNRRILPLVT
jgi:hypothetical protein